MNLIDRSDWRLHAPNNVVSRNHIILFHRFYLKTGFLFIPSFEMNWTTNKKSKIEK
jgi:hypothetical protein